VVEEPPTVGLRERKKQRTRELLVDSAVKLCLRQGYYRTTVEQIAAAADVSARTFSRYFATKEAVLVTVMDDLVDAAANELAAIPPSVPPLEALCRAHADMLRKVPTGRVPGLNAAKVALMVNVLSSAGELREAATMARPYRIVCDVAGRLGAEPSDGRVMMVCGVWASIVATAWANLVTESFEVNKFPVVMADRLDEMFAHFVDLAAVQAQSSVSSSA
jgi:AcrR family transcriptional regulator